MPRLSLTLALVQQSDQGSTAANLEDCEAAVRAASIRGCDLVLLQEPTTPSSAAPQGEILAQADDQAPKLLVAEVDLARTKPVRRLWPFLRDRRIDAYEDLARRFRD